MIEWFTDMLWFPLEWAVDKTTVFAVTAPYNQIFIAMGIAFVLMVVLIWSMIPKKPKSHNIELAPEVYVATEEDEEEARKVLIQAKAL